MDIFKSASSRFRDSQDSSLKSSKKSIINQLAGKKSMHGLYFHIFVDILHKSVIRMQLCTLHAGLHALGCEEDLYCVIFQNIFPSHFSYGNEKERHETTLVLFAYDRLDRLTKCKLFLLCEWKCV